jgi:ribosomal protein S18 acetylase RimI-like enzyme
MLEDRYEELIRNKDMIVLLVGEGPDGFAQLRFRPWVYSSGLHSYLEELYVVPDLRGNGLGRALLGAAMETARGEGAEFMELGTSETDVAARKLYESAGFINREGGPDGPVMFFYEREL